MVLVQWTYLFFNLTVLVDSCPPSSDYCVRNSGWIDEFGHANESCGGRCPMKLACASVKTSTQYGGKTYGIEDDLGTRCCPQSRATCHGIYDVPFSRHCLHPSYSNEMIVNAEYDSNLVVSTALCSSALSFPPHIRCRGTARAVEGVGSSAISMGTRRVSWRSYLLFGFACRCRWMSSRVVAPSMGTRDHVADSEPLSRPP